MASRTVISPPCRCSRWHMIGLLGSAVHGCALAGQTGSVTTATVRASGAMTWGSRQRCSCGSRGCSCSTAGHPSAGRSCSVQGTWLLLLAAAAGRDPAGAGADRRRGGLRDGGRVHLLATARMSTSTGCTTCPRSCRPGTAWSTSRRTRSAGRRWRGGMPGRRSRRRSWRAAVRAVGAEPAGAPPRRAGRVLVRLPARVPAVGQVAAAVRRGVRGGHLPRAAGYGARDLGMAGARPHGDRRDGQPADRCRGRLRLVRPRGGDGGALVAAPAGVDRLASPTSARTASWRRPLVETAPPPSSTDPPVRFVTRPPASTMTGTSAATSQTESSGSAATSTAPSATSRCDQKSPYARVRQHRSARSRKPAPPSGQPTTSEYDSEASDSSLTSETWIRLGSPTRPPPAHAPAGSAQPTTGGRALAPTRRRRRRRGRRRGRSGWPRRVRRGRSSWCRRSGRGSSGVRVTAAGRPGRRQRRTPRRRPGRPGVRREVARAAAARRLGRRH